VLGRDLRVFIYQLQLCSPFKTNFCNLIEFSITKITQNSIALAPSVETLQNCLYKIAFMDDFPTIPKA
jgi:hypothetical protein